VALANFCFLTKDTNLNISATKPEIYFEQVEIKHPGALASQWVPMDPALWKLDNYPAFLEARKALLADAANQFMETLLHGDKDWLSSPTAAPIPTVATPTNLLIGDDVPSEGYLVALNNWIGGHGLPPGEFDFDLADPATGEQVAVLDLAWPKGFQEGLSQPVALILEPPPGVIDAASAAGYRCFTSVEGLEEHVMHQSEPAVVEA